MSFASCLRKSMGSTEQMPRIKRQNFANGGIESRAWLLKPLHLGIDSPADSLHRTEPIARYLPMPQIKMNAKRFDGT